MAERIMAEPATEIYIANASGQVTGTRAVEPPRPPELPRPPEVVRTLSEFEQTLYLINRLEVSQGPDPERDIALQEAIERRNQLLREANDRGLFNNLKESLYQLYYYSRVEVTKEVKEGNRLPNLSNQLRDALQNPLEVEDFWSSPQSRGLDETAYKGIVDYFNRESISIIRAVVEDRKLSQYPDNGIALLWNHEWPDDKGERKEAANFDDVRDFIENERKKKPYVPSRGNYESYFEFVADDIEELGEMVPYVVDAMAGGLGTGQLQEMHQNLETKKRNIVFALEYFRKTFGFEIDNPKFRRVNSAMIGGISLFGSSFFADKVHENWEQYINYLYDIARGFEDTAIQDHIIDVLYFDKEGLRALALELYSQNDGMFWRYNWDGSEPLQLGDALVRQQQMRDQIEVYLIDHELISMNELLAPADPANPDGNPQHPAFARLKAKLDALDAQDLANGIALPNGPDGNPESRWNEYRRKAMRWQQTGEFGDPRDKRQRVIFQHPLARALTEEEFRAMYRERPLTGRERRLKLQTVKRAMEVAERLIRTFQLDAVAGGPRHIFRDQAALDAVTPFVQVPDINTVVPHVTLIKNMLQEAIRFDRTKPIERQRFKLYSIMTDPDKLGLNLDFPFFSAWYLGAHDTQRYGLLPYVRDVDEFSDILDENLRLRLAGDEVNGADEKTTLTRWVEDERRLFTIMEVIARRKFADWYNYPGHSTVDGGVKEFRNILFGPYGISRDTVEINGLIPAAWFGEHDLLRGFGCSNFRQFIGMLKGPDEVVFQKTGGFFVNPRDSEQWVKRFGSVVEQLRLWTSGKEGSHGMLNDGPISGAYHFRALDADASKYQTKTRVDDLLLAIKDPELAYKDMYEAFYERYIDTSIKIIAPLMTIMQSRLALENVYGRNPGTAMFLNTLLWYEVCAWMDRNWREYRGKFGYAIDADLYLARRFMHTVLYESRLIYNDQQWNEIMLGYTIPKEQLDRIQAGTATDEDKPLTRVIRYNVDQSGKTIAVDDVKVGDRVIANKGDVVEGRIAEGLLDGLPLALRKEVIDRKWLPYGLDSYWPETLEILNERNRKNESEAVRTDYVQVIPKQVHPRKVVIRP